jgi:MFS family permease
LNDKAAGIYNAFYSLGAITAPIVGGALTDAIGFRSACDVNAFACFGFFAIYALTNTRPRNYLCKKRAPSPNSIIKVKQVRIVEEDNEYVNDYK